ncbi:glycosyltransferase family 2 protein [Avibacterium paragallinarum]|uniref:CcbF1 n=3 Tax=Avibacterium paragallinarum TaxID=728 RepID=D0QYN7_AVIPA|nr:glycosyltransferase family A protein [Avibacterium paragallinarum]ACY25519.1 CcbF1 [Avibacterium paragallinarum]MEE3607443.1 glycosyltransferase family A protein [Avibacterium paragallinarum]MEE3682076.1 glycosyltransferase family A protein [Avibacterium paragallinarum]MEE4386741.1 glycosyltransferase family A protein [Avibacterium paragallinarum]PXZ39895.1 glycosyltransferase family 2 protein [Avibacterium paragallinarum]
MENKLQQLQNKRDQLGRNIGALDFLIDFYKKKNNNISFLDKDSFKTKSNAHKIHLLSEEISSKKSGEEFDFLLQYTDEIRKLELTETYIALVKYLCLHYHSLNLKNKKQFLVHISNALRISEDSEIIEIILMSFPYLIKDLPLSPKLKDKLFKTNFSGYWDYSQTEDKYLLFDLQDDPKQAFTFLIEKENIETKLKINPELYGVFCNNFSDDFEKYKIFFNKFLNSYALPLITKVNNGKGNILKRIQFENNDRIVLSKQKPLVSIVMSAYNSQDTIEYAINSLLNQSYQNIEIVVCDDCSKDNTFAILKDMELKNSKIRVYQSIKNQGTYNIRNEMIKLAKGEYITFHDSDDFALPTRIDEQVNILNNHQHIMLCVSQWVRIEPDGRFIYFFDGKLNRLCVVSSMIRKEILEKIGSFKSSLVAADTDFYERVIHFYGRESIYKLEKPLILGLWGDGSLTKQKTLVAGNSGFVAKKRRAFSDICARQRLLGNEIISDEDINDVLKEHSIFKENFGV